MFVGRKTELEQLEAALSRSSPSVVVIYGRRRIGKSELIRKALENRRALYFEGLESRPKRVQIKNFLFQLRHQGALDSIPSNIRDWREALLLMKPLLTRRPACIVLDEFQWMANHRHELVADLKMVWDQHFSRIPGVSLVLCGSIASFMTSRVIKSTALYGRTDLIIHLGPFDLTETAEMLGDRGWDEIVMAQLVSGGVPKYLDLVRDGASVQLALETLAFSPNGYLLDEYDRIFTSHFGKNADYQKIVELLAKHPYGLFRKEIAQKTGLKAGGRLSERLSELDLAGFISARIPLDKESGTRIIKYDLSDAYLRFYFAFIRSARTKIQAATSKQMYARLTQTGRYYDWRGRAFEYVCMAHAARIAEILGFAGIDFNAGPYFRSPSRTEGGVQIDLLFDRPDDVLTLCEMKLSHAPVGKSVVSEVERKAESLHRLYPRKTIQRVLVVHGDASRELSKTGYFYRIVNSRELAS